MIPSARLAMSRNATEMIRGLLPPGAVGVLSATILSLGVAAPADAQSKFVSEVKPFLKRYCLRCHGQTKQKAGLNLHGYTDGFESDEAVEGWVKVLDALTFEEMPPPETRTQPRPAATARVVEWIQGRLETTGTAEAYRAKLLAPEYGNRVDHEKLFSGEITTPPSSPSRLWRMSPAIFRKRGFPRARSPFTFVTRKSGIRDYAVMSAVDQSTLQMILINAEQVFEHRRQRGQFKGFLEAEGPLTAKLLTETVRRQFRFVIGRAPTDEELSKYRRFLETNVETGGRLGGLETTIKALFLSPEALYRFEFGRGKKDRDGRRHLSPEELACTLAYALTDRGPARTDAIREAYAKGQLSDRDDVARVVREVLDDELGTGHWSRRKLPRVMRFFEEFFGFDRAGDVFKDNQRRRLEGILQWNTDILVWDARMLIEHHLRRDEDVIASLLTTDRFFVCHPGDNDYAREYHERVIAEVTHPDYIKQQIDSRRAELAKRKNRDPEQHAELVENTRQRAERKVRRVTRARAAGLTPFPEFPFNDRTRGLADFLYIGPYNLPASGSAEDQEWSWPIDQPFAMPERQRAGLLTHPAWLAAHSLNDGNDPIRRGIWVREKLLAGVIQDVPPDVDANVPIDPHKTLRERMEPLRAERCWGCHKKINPLGETFEIYDDWGRFRTHVYFDDKNEIVTRRDRRFERLKEQGELTPRAIDATGAITGSGDPKIDGDVKDAIEMMNRLGRSDRARQSVIRHLFRYLMGRNETLDDSRTMVEAEQAYLREGGSFKALVVSLLSSDSFLYRR